MAKLESSERVVDDSETLMDSVFWFDSDVSVIVISSLILAL